MRNYLAKTVEHQNQLGVLKRTYHKQDNFQGGAFVVTYALAGSGRRFVFGYSNDANGGWPMYSARLLSWVKNPCVVTNIPGYDWDRTGSGKGSTEQNPKRAANI